jgi:hypothetical protein
MTDKIQKQITEAAYADALLRNEFLWEQFGYLEKEYTEAWKTTPARDTDARERLWQAVQVVGKVRQHLTTVLNDGKIAKTDLERLASKQG